MCVSREKSECACVTHSTSSWVSPSGLVIDMLWSRFHFLALHTLVVDFEH